MAELDIQKKQGVNWIWWLIGLIVLALIVWWLVMSNGNDANVTQSPGEPTPATAPATAPPPTTPP